MPPETGATTDPLTAAVQRDKVTQEVRKLSAEALKAEVDAYTPSLPASLPVGTTTAAPGTVSPIGALAAFKALEKAAARIRDHLPTEGVSGVWIVPAGHWMRAKTAHDVLTDQLPRLRDALNECHALLGEEDPPEADTPGEGPRAFVAAAVAGISLVSSVLPLLATLTKTDTTVAAGSLTIPFGALSATVAHALLRVDALDVAIAGLADTAPGDVDRDMASLRETRDTLQRALTQFRRAHSDVPAPEAVVAAECLDLLKKVVVENPAELDARWEQVRTEAGVVAADRRRAADDAARSSAVQRIVDEVDRFLAQASTADPTGVTPVALAREYAQRKNHHVLHLEASYGGNESQWQARGWRRGRGFHVGAAVVTFVLADTTGATVDSAALKVARTARTTMGKATIGWM